ncbi:hypothetical protein O181_083307 [Austropuccinia psidii MF-1]|uniref:Uncharacterized protein n=1 Tax=Austropuccinia psidii MF-1 TaxID=1389203 RepID=A0A9Q3FS38_9BASI|nr:hypothetical protein [Austropuccinia psidii MF-1]
MDPRPPLKCAYCKEEGHSAIRFTHLDEDFDRRVSRTKGEYFLFPIFREYLWKEMKVPKKVRTFSKEQAELNKKFMEKPTLRPRPQEEVNPTEKKLEDK